MDRVFVVNCIQEERRSRTPYGRLKTDGAKRQHGNKISSVFVNPLRGRAMTVGAGRRSNSTSSRQHHQQLLQLQLAGPLVDAPYDAVLLDNEDVAL